MKNDVIPVQVRRIVAMHSGCAIFVGNDEKVFIINVEPQIGAVISMFMHNTPKERPLTHDLMGNIFKAFGITIERVVITELKNSTYYARLILQEQNELGRKIVELDARPSDCGRCWSHAETLKRAFTSRDYWIYGRTYLR